MNIFVKGLHENINRNDIEYADVIISVHEKGYEIIKNSFNGVTTKLGHLENWNTPLPKEMLNGMNVEDIINWEKIKEAYNE